MRTVLDIDDDVIEAAEGLAREQQTTPGKVISDLARQSLVRDFDISRLEVRNGFLLLPRTGKPITPEFIESLLQEDP